MLSRLSIFNYALIESLEMKPHGALNIITGETGAGKSIMLGAVGLLLGNRADTKVLYDQQRKCIIEGEFNISMYDLREIFDKYDLDFEDDSLIRREITPSGKSRAFVNDTPVTLDVLKDLGAHLMDIHSQHQTILLGNATFQLNVIDLYAETKKELEHYRKKFAEFRSANKHLEALKQNAERLAQESDYNSFLLNELVEANLLEDEQEGLEEELKLLEHAEEIKANLNNLLNIIDRNEQNISTQLLEAGRLSGQISKYTDALSGIDKRLTEASIELNDILREIEGQESLLEVDVERMEYVREKISLLYHLQNKHHVDGVKGLLEIQERLEKETFLANNLEEEITKAEQEAEVAGKAMMDAGKQLSSKRTAVFKPFSAEITGLLVQLGIPDAKVEISCKVQEPTNDGLDNIVLMFSANKGVAPAPINKVASGGEYSRLMFCFRYVMAGKTKLPTMVFDEIDSGISGEVALQMGAMIQEMATNHQVITISHLPQIAARGQAHYFVYKTDDTGRSVSKVRMLNETEKIEEIAKMISGENPSASAFTSAKELISN